MSLVVCPALPWAIIETPWTRLIDHLLTRHVLSMQVSKILTWCDLRQYYVWINMCTLPLNSSTSMRKRSHRIFSGVTLALDSTGDTASIYSNALLAGANRRLVIFTQDRPLRVKSSMYIFHAVYSWGMNTPILLVYFYSVRKIGILEKQKMWLSS